MDETHAIGDEDVIVTFTSRDITSKAEKKKCLPKDGNFANKVVRQS